MIATDSVDPTVAGSAIEQADPLVLTRIAQPDIHLAVWWRRLPATLGWLVELDWQAIDDLDFAVLIVGIEAGIADGLADAGYPTDRRGTALAADITDLARRFARIFGIAAVRIRLEVIETDACRRFHADYVAARLLTTFVGQGTQWCLAETGPDAPIRQMRAGDVGIFKGRFATDTPAILHRSPPIAALGEKRLLLAIDPFDPSPPVPESPSE